jgi:hypothetical protein
MKLTPTNEDEVAVSYIRGSRRAKIYCILELQPIFLLSRPIVIVQPVLRSNL